MFRTRGGVRAAHAALGSAEPGMWRGYWRFPRPRRAGQTWQCQSDSGPLSTPAAVLPVPRHPDTLNETGSETRIANLSLDRRYKLIEIKRSGSLVISTCPVCKVSCQDALGASPCKPLKLRGGFSSESSSKFRREAFLPKIHPPAERTPHFERIDKQGSATPRLAQKKEGQLCIVSSSPGSTSSSGVANCFSSYWSSWCWSGSFRNQGITTTLQRPGRAGGQDNSVRAAARNSAKRQPSARIAAQSEARAVSRFL